MRNRQMLGPCFAASMGWRLAFIVWMLIGHWDCYLETIYPAGGPETRLRLREPGGDDGVYAMWLAFWGTYTATLLVVEDPPVVAWGDSATGLAAWMLRVAAFAKERTNARVALSL